MEFKYENEKELFEITLAAVKDALTEKELIPPAKDSGRADWGTVKQEKTVEKGAEPFEVNRGIPKPSYNAGNYSKSYNILQTLKKQEEEEKQIDDGSQTQSKLVVELSSDAEKHTYNTNKAYTDSKIVTDEDLPEHLASAVKKVNGKQLSIFNDEILPEKEKIKYKLIGQLFDTYWLIEYDRNLYIMDQHAAHEKIKYEQLMRDFKNKEILSQQLMPPLVITVTYQERETVLEYYDLFMQIGYDIVEFGGNEFKINAVPSNLYGISEKALFMEFISSLMENSGYVSNDIFIRKLSTMACKSAIKGNTHITYQEADNLVKQLFELENPYTCPHGRPTIISMSEAEIEKKFRRIV
jgi:DNA mismatch repair protein MutL